MPTPALCTDNEIVNLVYSFYAKVRCDEVLGPIFDAHISDWDHHLGKMVDFWSSILRGTGRYHGTPMPKHVVLPELNAALFQRWLGLFRDTTRAIGNEAMGRHADAMAQRIAQSLWYGYQLHKDPHASPSGLALNPS